MTRQTQLTVNVIVIILPFKILFSKNICELHKYALLSLMIILDSIKLKTTEMSGDCAGIFFQLQTGLFLKQNADIHTLVWGRQKQLVTLCCRVHNDKRATPEECDNSHHDSGLVYLFSSSPATFTKLLNRTWLLLLRLKVWPLVSHTAFFFNENWIIYPDV